MRIAIVNTHTEKGGASKAAFRLGQGLDALGEDVAYLVKKLPAPDPEDAPPLEQIRRFSQAEHLDALSSLVNTFYIAANRSGAGNTLFTFPGLGRTPQLLDHLRECDVINLHWVEKFLTPADISGIFRLNRPVVWTLHDQRPFTGGCHYSNGCSRYEDECGACPQLDEDPLDLSRVALRMRQASIDPAGLTLVSPSRWLAEKAGGSAAFRGCRIEVIANGIDPAIFTPGDRQAARAGLGIAPEAVVLMFGAQNSRERRKGFDILSEAVHSCAGEVRLKELLDRERLCIVHAGSENEETEALPIPVVNTGYIHNDREMAAVYTAADMFILPSREDNLPNTMLESLACGTPVIATDVGGIPEVVSADNGILVDNAEDAEALARAMIALIDDSDRRRQLGENGARLVRERFTIAGQARAYRQLFTELNGAAPLAGNPEGVEPCDEELLAFTGASAARAGELLEQFNFLKQAHKKQKSRASLFEYKYKRLDRAFTGLLNDAMALAEVSGRRYPREKFRRYKKLMTTAHEQEAWDRGRKKYRGDSGVAEGPDKE